MGFFSRFPFFLDKVVNLSYLRIVFSEEIWLRSSAFSFFSTLFIFAFA